MSENKDTKKSKSLKKSLTKPEVIKGKIEVPDIRELRDAPEGN